MIISGETLCSDIVLAPTTHTKMDKIRILFVSANPLEKGAIRLDAEVRIIFERISESPGRHYFELIRQPALSLTDLHRVLMRFNPQIVHFSGHGSLSQEIVMEDDVGDGNTLTRQALERTFSLFRNNVKVVFLDGCFTQGQAEAINSVIDYTLGTDKRLPTPASTAFAAAFYQALSFGRSVKSAFESARAELSFTRIPKSMTPKLLVRQGVNDEEALVSLIERSDREEGHTLTKAFERVAAGEANKEDRSLVRRALIEGSLTLEQVDPSGTVEATMETTEEVHRTGGSTETKGVRESIEESSIRIGIKEDVRSRGGIAPDDRSKGIESEEHGKRIGTKEDIRSRGGIASDDRSKGIESEEHGKRIGIGEDIRSRGRIAPEGRSKNLKTKEYVKRTGTKEDIRGTQLRVSPSLYEKIQRELFPAPRGLPPPLPGLVFVGREDSLMEVKRLIGVGQSESQKNSVTVVRGWPGVGKTTLVSVLARDPEVSEAFPDGVLWTALDQKPEMMSKIAQWARALGTDDLLYTPTIAEATERLGLLLRDKRMLLVVDDIWNVDHARPFLQAASDSKCAVLAITRLTSIADALASLNPSRTPAESIYVLPVFAEDDALTLLRLLAPEVVARHPEACRELLRDLEYLPLAIHVAGGVLNEKLRTNVPDLSEWIRKAASLEAEPSPLDRAEGIGLPTVRALLLRSTDLLDDATREYFAYLGAFAPKPATFDVGALKAVWMVDDPKPVIRKLVSFGLLELVGSGRFQMHALLVQHARSLLT
jgi:NB-ARC domain